MHVTPLIWGITIAVLVAVLLIDVVIIGRRPHEPSMKEAGIFVGIYIALAILFGFGIWQVSGAQYAGEFFAGWITEYSLSIDNLFVFLLIMAGLKVPRHYQQYALMVGIVLALVFRGIFIALGAALIERFAWIFYVFGAFLLFTAVKLVMDYFSHDDDEAADGWFLRWLRRTVPSTPEYHGTRQLVRVDGRWLMTPMMVVIIALGTTDIMFALDSIPAIYGLTQEPYLVFTANVFALMGLRQLYFLLGNALRKLVYLSIGLAVVLGFIGVKLVLHAMHHYGIDQAWLGINGEIDTGTSLFVIIVTLVVTTVASLVRARSMNQPGATTQ